ncbi:MAG: hypothetical protein L0Z62_18610 [Gemmataceae bacterium]|nr:hypothetical protein [Gemmataceae bacterium]
MSGPAATSAAKIIQAERRAQALALRRQGKTFEYIGLSLGVSRQRACKLVQDELRVVSP